jgi:hypothetical protein
MQSGGNAPLTDWFKKYPMAENIDLPTKYKTQAAKYFRELLKAKAEGVPFEEPEPDGEDALEICDEYLPKIPPAVPQVSQEPLAISSESIADEEPNPSPMDKLGGFFASMKTKA